MKLKLMYVNSVVLIGLVALLFSCKEQPNEISTISPKVQVKLTHVSQGYLPNYIELIGNTIYLNKTRIVAPISGYVTKVNIKQGDKVKSNEELFILQSPEAFALKQDDLGLIKIKAPTTGQLINLNIVNKNIYVDKGAVLCSLLTDSDLRLQVNVPYEYSKLIKLGVTSSVILPDSTTTTAVFTKILPQIDEQSQTIKAIAKIHTSKFIPENVIVKVLLDKSTKHQSQILPKNCIQTNALMTKYWVMKLINDSTAISVNVKIGNQTHTQTEVLSPKFLLTDKIVSQGAYGLEDTTLVNVMK